MDTALVTASRTVQEPGSQPSQQIVVFDPRPSQLAALAKLEQVGTSNAGSQLRPRHVRYHPYERLASRRVGTMGWARDVDIATPASLVPDAVATSAVPAALPAPIETPELRQPSLEVLESLRGPIIGTFNPVAAFGGATQLPPQLPQHQQQQPAPPSPRTVFVRQLEEEAQRSDSVSAFGHVWQQMLDQMAKLPQLALGLPQIEPASPAPAPAPVATEAPLHVTPAPAPEPTFEPEPEPEPVPVPTPEPMPVLEPEPVPEPEREREPAPEPESDVEAELRAKEEAEMMAALEEELALVYESDEELEFEDVPIPVATRQAPKPQPAAVPFEERSEADIEAALTLQALALGIDLPSSQGAPRKREIRKPKSLKARMKVQPKPKPESKPEQPAPRAQTPPFSLRNWVGGTVDSSPVKEDQLKKDNAEFWAAFEKEQLENGGYKFAQPGGKKQRITRGLLG